MAFVGVAVLAHALGMIIAVIPFDFVALAYDFMGAISFTAAVASGATVVVGGAFLVAPQEVGASVRVATAGQTLEVVVAVVGVELLALETGRGVHTGQGRTTEGRVDAVVVAGTIQG